MTSSARANWLIPTALVALAFVPVVAGSLRLQEMLGGPAVLPDGDRVTSSPVALATHIVSVTVFSLLGAFQFAPGIRKRHRGRHRLAGRIVVPAGVLTAVSGLWLTVFLPRGAIDSDATSAVRVVVATAMITSLLLGLAAILRRDFHRHRAWMIRGYAIGMGAGTQFFTQAAWLIAVGPVTTSGKTITLTAGWVINVIVAEWIIRRGASRPTRSVQSLSVVRNV